MKRITTGDLARELSQFFPQITNDMIRNDAESGLLKTFPRFSDTAWYYIDPDFLPEYLDKKLKNHIPPTAKGEVLTKLNINFKQVKLSIVG